MMLRSLTLALALLAGAPAAAETVIIHAGRLITDASRPARGPSTITVTDGRITAVADGLRPAPAGATLVDLSTKTVLPGLVDAHTHLTSNPGGDYWKEAVDSPEYAVAVGVRNALTTARAGFTTVRDVGSYGEAGFALRRGTAEGLFPGPRIQTSGPAISIIGGHGDVSGFRPEVLQALATGSTCTGAEECAAKVRQASRAGADLIKITATGGVLSQQGRGLEAHFTDAEMGSIVRTAHSLGLKVAAHAHGARGIEAASRAGVDSIEHGTFGDEAALRQMKRTGSAMVPTLMAFTGIEERLGKGVYTPVVETKIRQTLTERGKALRRAKQMGVPIVFGTDSGVFEHGRNGQEFALMVRYGGLTPAEALRSATTDAAKLMNRENEIGRIQPGYSADIIAVDGDPLRDVRTLEKVDYVMVRGKAVPMEPQSSESAR